MRVIRFRDEYERIAPLLGQEAASLRTRDAELSPARWYVTSGAEVVGVATARLRPDERLFLRLVVTTTTAYAPLVEAVDEGEHPLATIVDAGLAEHVAALEALGFEVENRLEAFVVPFELVLPLLRRAWLPGGYRIARAEAVDEAALFQLDNAIRNLVPGSDGWRGDRTAFHAEMTAPEHDPAAYLVAIERATGKLVGLVRVWRNDDGPRLGLIGVLPDHRAQPLAAVLLRQALTAAAGWGHASFATETSPDNPLTYPRVRRMGLSSVARYVQLVRRARHVAGPT